MGQDIFAQRIYAVPFLLFVTVKINADRWWACKTTRLVTHKRLRVETNHLHVSRKRGKNNHTRNDIRDWAFPLSALVTVFSLTLSLSLFSPCLFVPLPPQLGIKMGKYMWGKWKKEIIFWISSAELIQLTPWSHVVWTLYCTHDTTFCLVIRNLEVVVVCTLHDQQQV